MPVKMWLAQMGTFRAVDPVVHGPAQGLGPLMVPLWQDGFRHPIQPVNHGRPGSVLRSKEGSGWSAGALTADASLIFVSKPTGLTERG